MCDQGANPDIRLATIAAQQHGVVSVKQLREAGLDKHRVRHRVRIGRLHAVHRGVYAVGNSHLSTEGRWMAAALACGAGAVLSHRSAAAVWRLLPDQLNTPVDISVRTDTGRKNRPGIRLHRRPSLDPKDVTRYRGIAVTVPARTIADLAQFASAVEVRRARRKDAVLGFRIDDASEDDATRSELEFLFLKLCRRHKLPAPEVNVWVAGVLVDFVWRERRLIVETDGYRYHRGRVSFEDERARDLQLRSQGFEVVRLTYGQVARKAEETATVLKMRLAD